MEEKIDGKNMWSDSDVQTMEKMEREGILPVSTDEVIARKNAWREAERQKWVEGMAAKAIHEKEKDLLAMVAFDQVPEAAEILAKEHDFFGQKHRFSPAIRDGLIFDVCAKENRQEMLMMLAENFSADPAWPDWVAKLPERLLAHGHRDTAIVLLKDDRFGPHADIYADADKMLRSAALARDDGLMGAIMSRIDVRYIDTYLDFFTQDDFAAMGKDKQAVTEGYFNALETRKKSQATTPTP